MCRGQQTKRRGSTCGGQTTRGEEAKGTMTSRCRGIGGGRRGVEESDTTESTSREGGGFKLWQERPKR